MTFSRFLAIAIASALLIACSYAQNSPIIPESTIAINSATPMSQRVVHYEIDAKYNATNHTVDATELLTYHNLTGQPLDRFPFHLYLNAFQPESTWVRETKRDGTRDVEEKEWESKYNGADDIKSFEVVDMGDLTSKLEFIQPNDGTKNDRTVVKVQLISLELAIK